MDVAFSAYSNVYQLHVATLEGAGFGVFLPWDRSECSFGRQNGFLCLRDLVVATKNDFFEPIAVFLRFGH